MARRFLTLLVASLVLLLSAHQTFAGANANAKILIHLTPPTAKVPCTRSAARPACGDIVTEGDLNRGYFAYVLVTDGDATAGLAGLQMGISYKSALHTGVDVVSWNLCATLQFSSSTPPWPAAGSSNLMTWDATTQCQRFEPGGAGTGVTAVAGYFYCAAYSADTLRAIPRPLDGLAKVADCNSNEDLIDSIFAPAIPSPLGYAVFSAGAVDSGYSPCGVNPLQGVMASVPSGLDFGAVGVGQCGTRTVELYNANSRHTSVLHITSFSMNGINRTQFTLVNPPSLPVDLHGGGTERLSLELQFCPTGGPATAALVALGDGINSPLRIQLTGQATEPPPTPSTCSATDDDPFKITFSWHVVPNVQGYRVSRDGVLLAEVGPSVTSLPDTVAVGSYRYCVRAVDAAGQSGECCDFGTRPPACSIVGPTFADVCSLQTFMANILGGRDSTFTGFHWDFGDGGTADTQQVTHVWRADSGERDYTVILTVETALHELSSCDQLVHVAAPWTTIKGQVTNLDGNPISGARIDLYGPAIAASSPIRSVATDAEGNYELPTRPGVDFAVHCSKNEVFWDQWATGISICPGAGREVDFTLLPMEKTSGIVRLHYNGLRPGGTTWVSFTVRAPANSKYHLDYETHFGDFDPGKGTIKIGSLAQGDTITMGFPLHELTGKPSKDPLQVKLYLYRFFNPIPIDVDVLYVIADSPLSDPDDGLFTQTTARNLLERYQPIFAFDSHERYLPKDIDIMLDRAIFQRVDDPFPQLKNPVAVHRGLMKEAPAFSDLTVDLISGPDPSLDFFGDDDALPLDYSSFESTYPSKIYGTAMRKGDSAYLSYWFYSFFEQWGNCARHEGDWEGVTVGLKLAGSKWAPDSMFFGHHPVGCLSCTEEGRKWNEVDSLGINGRAVRIAYVADESHGVYPSHGTTDVYGLPCDDVHEGTGAWVLPTDAPQQLQCQCSEKVPASLEIIPRFDLVGPTHPGAWALFAGNWGATKNLAGVSLFRPSGPAIKGDWRWTDPSEWAGHIPHVAYPIGFPDRHPGGNIPGLKISATAVSGIVQVRYSLELPQMAQLTIFDVAGRQVWASGGIYQGSGPNMIVWNGGGATAAGLYFARLTTASGPAGTAKVLIAR